MTRPTVVKRNEWLAARKELLAREKEFTRQRDALSEARRRLPMLEVTKHYVFDGPTGRTTLLDLFEGRRQLVVYHFMFDPSWDEGCKGCSFVLDNLAGNVDHLAARDTSFVVVSRAPLAKSEPFRQRMDWQVPWVSSFNNEFNYDFQVTLDEEQGHRQYNYDDVGAQVKAGKSIPPSGEAPGLSVFLRDGQSVFHTYSTYARGHDLFLNTYNLLDLTPFGRQEEAGKGMAWLRHHDRYETPATAGRCHCS
jgi:predicted dithiol-disulfide oxidoreductase (DUF899 family)